MSGRFALPLIPAVAAAVLVLIVSAAQATPDTWMGHVIEGCDPDHQPNFLIALPNNVSITINTEWAQVAQQKTPTSYKSGPLFERDKAFIQLCGSDDDSCAVTSGVVLIDRIKGDTINGSFNVANDNKVVSASFTANRIAGARPQYCR